MRRSCTVLAVRRAHMQVHQLPDVVQIHTSDVSMSCRTLVLLGRLAIILSGANIISGAVVRHMRLKRMVILMILMDL